MYSRRSARAQTAAASGAACRGGGRQHGPAAMLPTARNPGACGGGDSGGTARALLRTLRRLLAPSPARRKVLRRAEHAVRTLALSRPRAALAAGTATAAAGLLLIWFSASAVLAAVCGGGGGGLCRLVARSGGGIKMPELSSEGERAGGDGAGIMAAAGRDAHAAFSGVGWRMARASPPPAERTEVRIAYFVQVGADSVALLPRLFRRLHHADNVYVVHVDAKVDAAERDRFVRLVEESDAYRRNVHFLPSEMVTYKGVSMVLNTVAGMTLARRVDDGWDYFINLSGADYPLLTPTDQRRLLARPGVPAGRLNFLSLFPKHEWGPYAFRVKFQYWDPAVVGHEEAKSRVRRMRSMRINPLEPFRRYTFVKAEAWMVLSRHFCDFIVRSDFAKRMLLNHVHVLSAPEHYFADVLYNHPLWRQTLVSDAFRKVVWYHKKRRGGQHPYVLDKPDKPVLEFWMYLAETRSMFARKFSVPDSPLQDKIDQELSGAEPPPVGDPVRASELAAGHARFYGRLAAHFDSLTKDALKAQGVAWPDAAYPPL